MRQVSEVGEHIRGKVGINIASGIFTNACAIRISYALNNSGPPVSRGVWATSSGKDGKWYLYRANDLVPYLTKKFGSPDITVESPKSSDFSGKKGIIVFRVNQWSDVTGHATCMEWHVLRGCMLFSRV
ncbi:type VI secretion system amidase effector protein Tae4 [Lampropedia aestuarii]|uniref:type VI secretion system amidase effector protein Tae4 n=1 Tax=Lampropedia aestuarii TaxID=2562762 RepID=UPI00197D4A34